MMAAPIIALLEGVFILVCVVLLIYLVFKRIKEKGNEGFEERDN